MESLQECSTCLEENDFSALACDARCDNQSQNILDMISDIGSDGMAYSGMMKRGKSVIEKLSRQSKEQKVGTIYLISL